MSENEKTYDWGRATGMAALLFAGLAVGVYFKFAPEPPAVSSLTGAPGLGTPGFVEGTATPPTSEQELPALEPQLSYGERARLQEMLDRQDADAEHKFSAKRLAEANPWCVVEIRRQDPVLPAEPDGDESLLILLRNIRTERTVFIVIDRWHGCYEYWTELTEGAEIDLYSQWGPYGYQGAGIGRWLTWQPHD